uniref:Hemopexin n=1 Tax=Hucho hucho TaxID=62062 RepID=A0A4W5JF99_9TELE
NKIKIDQSNHNQHCYHCVQDDKVYVYKVGEPHTHLEGYPKPLLEVLGVEGPIDAAFVCQDHHIAHIIKGQTIYDVDLKASPRVPVKEGSFTLFGKVDAGMCGPEGVKLFKGNHYFHFQSLKVMLMAKAIPEEHKTALELFGCDH